MNMQVDSQGKVDGLTARCHCGGVSFILPTNRTGVVACHCTDCRTLHGNYNAMLAVPREAIVMLFDDTLAWYDSSKNVRRGFCSRCGSRLFKDRHLADHVMVSAGSVIGPVGARIVENLFKESKGDWYELPRTSCDELPTA